jgi:N utilization substance protein B
MLDAANGESAIKNPVAELQKSFDNTRDLFVYLLYFITEVAKYAETDAVKKSNKHLPSEKDLNINTKLSGNHLLWNLLEDASFIKVVEKLKPQRILNQEILKRAYSKLVESPEYQLYILEKSREKEKEKNIVRFIFTDILLPDEVFTSHLEEFFNNWDDDCGMMDILVNNYISKPSGYNFEEVISHDKWIFAKSLLETTFNKRESLLDFIKPKLQNWDPERIAAVDMVLMKMGMAEFLFFETIPTKVTINEYIDLAKEYSTEQSGHFINGILDNIHKEMVAEGKLNKVGFKQVR